MLNFNSRHQKFSPERCGCYLAHALTHSPLREYRAALSLNGAYLNSLTVVSCVCVRSGPKVCLLHGI